MYTVRPAGLKTWKVSVTITKINSWFADSAVSFAQFKMHYWWSVTWLD
jgi:hypothetical protein